MAASKNNSNTNSSAESNGGFKTVAFGFDKNDVTLYIAGLRKKMKSMEEEFEQKLSQALENPTASNEALKHEREVIRAEMEKMWGDKLNERNNILKQQQNRINELEEQAEEDKNTIASLKAQLTAATSESNTDGAINARAAKAYMQFTAELRAISDSVNKTLMQIHNSWSGDFGAKAEEIAQAEAQAMEAAVVSASAAAPAPASAPVTAPAPSQDKPAAAPEPYIVGDPFEEVEEKNPLEDLIADINADVKAAPSNDYADIDLDLLADTDADDSSEEIDKKPKAEPVKEAAEPKKSKTEKPAKASPSTEPAAAKPKPVKAEEKPADEVDFSMLLEEPEPEAAAEDDDVDISSLLSDDSPAISAPKPAAPIKKARQPEVPPAIAADDDLSSLISEPKPAAPPKKARQPEVSPAIAADDDLSSLLADDTEVTAVDNRVGETDDFADLLAEFDKPVDKGDDIVLEDVKPKIDKGIDLDVDILSDIVINPESAEKTADLESMLNEQNNDDFAEFGDLFVTPIDEERKDGLGISAENIDFGADSVDDLAVAAKEKAKKAKKEDDPFDFSFLEANSEDDEDDMSTDVSFGGMM